MDRALLVAEMIITLGLSPRDRFALGTSLIVDAVAIMNKTCPDNNPFKDVTVTIEEPYEYAMQGLQSFLAFADTQNAPQEAQQEVVKE